MSNENENDRKREGGTAVKERSKTKQPRLYKVLFHNDDYTTMEFVIEVLTRFFQKNHTEAMQLMLFVHTKGKAIVGLYPREVAETKVQQVLDYAAERGHPLLVSKEPN